jgi:hypothetical protein
MDSILPLEVYTNILKYDKFIYTIEYLPKLIDVMYLAIRQNFLSDNMKQNLLTCLSTPVKINGVINKYSAFDIVLTQYHCIECIEVDEEHDGWFPCLSCGKIVFLNRSDCQRECAYCYQDFCKETCCFSETTDCCTVCYKMGFPIEDENIRYGSDYDLMQLKRDIMDKKIKEIVEERKSILRPKFPKYFD